MSAAPFGVTDVHEKKKKKTDEDHLKRKRGGGFYVIGIIQTPQTKRTLTAL